MESGHEATLSEDDSDVYRPGGWFGGKRVRMRSRVSTVTIPDDDAEQQQFQRSTTQLSPIIESPLEGSSEMLKILNSLSITEVRPTSNIPTVPVYRPGQGLLGPKTDLSDEPRKARKSVQMTGLSLGMSSSSSDEEKSPARRAQNGQANNGKQHVPAEKIFWGKDQTNREKSTSRAPSRVAPLYSNGHRPFGPSLSAPNPASISSPEDHVDLTRPSGRISQRFPSARISNPTKKDSSSSDVDSDSDYLLKSVAAANRKRTASDSGSAADVGDGSAKGFDLGVLRYTLACLTTFFLYPGVTLMITLPNSWLQALILTVIGGIFLISLIALSIWGHVRKKRQKASMSKKAMSRKESPVVKKTAQQPPSVSGEESSSSSMSDSLATTYIRSAVPPSERPRDTDAGEQPDVETLRQPSGSCRSYS